MKKFLKQINKTFDINEINSQIKPIKCFKSKITDIPYRINHYCLKQNDSDQLFLNGLTKETQDLVKKIITFSKRNKLPQDRYIYLTLDNKIIPAGKTQRLPDWHIDGFQGEEVPIKQDADYQFILFNKLSPEFCIQDFDLTHFDESKYNIFNYLKKQINTPSFKLDENAVYLMNPYMLHQSSISEHPENNRLFFRLSFSKIPITSIKMTVNPKIKYNYKIHSSSGEIPHYLI